jgi:hypothetical protein
MRHDNRVLLSVLIRYGFGRAGKAEAGQELAYKASPTLKRQGATLQFRAGG